MFRIALIVLIFQTLLICSSNAQYQITDKCTQVWEAIIDLKLNTADSIIISELEDNPTNYYAHYLAQTSDAYRFMINMSEEQYERILDKYNYRIDIMEDKDPESPYYLQCLSEMQLQMGMFNIIFGDRLSGLRKAYGAYKKTYRNIEKFPEFQGSYKLDGIFNVAIANLPPFVSWAASAFGVKGDYETGYEILNKYYDYFSNYPGLSKEAALYNVLAFKLNKDPQTAYEFIQSRDSSFHNYQLLKYFHANVSYRTGHNEEAAKILFSSKQSDNEVYFNGYNYLAGKILMRRLDTRAITYFIKYLKNQHEDQYLKAINYRIALLYLISDNEEKFEYYKNIARNTGNEITERDREAMYDCDLDYKPDATLVKARLTIDGGYLDIADTLLDRFLKNNEVRDPVSPYNLEYIFLRGKLEYKRANYIKAIIYFKEVIDLGSEEDYYFAAEAAMYLGYINEEKDKIKALESYKLSRELYQSNFYEYIDEISKKRINKVN